MTEDGADRARIALARAATPVSSIPGLRPRHAQLACAFRRILHVVPLRAAVLAPRPKSASP